MGEIHGFDPFTVKGHCWDNCRHLAGICAFNSNGAAILIS